MLKYEIFVNEKGEEKVRFDGHKKEQAVSVDKNDYKNFSISGMRSPSTNSKSFLHRI